jgi:DNA mismatch endonuclease (patch repair protein)
MRQVKSRDTKPEMVLRKKLHAKGVRYRVHYTLDGKPDFVIVSKKVVVFVDGCFWHKCPVCFRAPKSNTEYWKSKIERNLERDSKITSALEAKGWKVIRIWEHEIRKNLNGTVERLLNELSAANGG